MSADVLVFSLQVRGCAGHVHAWCALTSDPNCIVLCNRALCLCARLCCWETRGVVWRTTSRMPFVLHGARPVLHMPHYRHDPPLAERGVYCPSLHFAVRVSGIGGQRARTRTPRQTCTFATVPRRGARWVLRPPHRLPTMAPSSAQAVGWAHGADTVPTWVGPGSSACAGTSSTGTALTAPRQTRAAASRCEAGLCYTPATPLHAAVRCTLGASSRRSHA